MLILLAVTAIVVAPLYTGNLSILSLSPPTFQLQFSKPIQYPSFQLLLNNVVIDYKPHKTDFSDRFVFETEDVNSLTQQSQIYTLVFTEPLSMGLSLDSFVLLAEDFYQQEKYQLKELNRRDQFFTYQEQSESFEVAAIVLIALIYLSCFLDLAGFWMTWFVQIYTYVQIHSPYYSSFDYYMAKYLLLTPEQDYSVILLIPYIIFISSFVLGIGCRFGLNKCSESSWVCRLVRDYFSYNFFIICSRIMLFPLLVTTINLVIQGQQFTYSRWFLLIYFGFLLTVAYLYLSLLILNPQCSQSNEKWGQYLKSDHFLMFNGLYSGLKLQHWITRNYNLYVTCERIIIAICASLFDSILVVFILQCIHLLYLFIVRPYQNSLYEMRGLWLQLLICIFYGYILVVNLYFGMSLYIITNGSVGITIFIRLILFWLIVTIMMVLTAYEIYLKCRDLKGIIRKNRYEKKVKAYEEEQRIRTESEERRNQSNMHSLHLTKMKMDSNDEETIRKRNKSKIKHKEKKQLQKRSLLQNLAKNSQ